MSAIDFHTHAFPDDLAGRAMRKLQEQAGYPVAGDGRIESLLASMDAANIDVSVVCAVATKPGQARGILKWCRRVRCERIEPFPSVHPDEPKAAKWIGRIAKAGFLGVKLHPMYQAFAADEDRMAPVYAAAAEHGLIVALHCGQDIGFAADDDRAAPRRVADVRRRFAHLKLLCTHMGGWRQWDQVEAHLLGRDVYLETSFSLAELGRERSVEFIRRHGPERVVFGSDWPWRPQAGELDGLNRLGLPAADLRRIAYSNASALLGY
ncbi:MAG TPA: amidohydrolase family protein [Phycisphaerae bacterium]|nr:amidohydrolase family protein [Phycisphaerae bacterium]